jgi:heme-degrading monooxygenase HmoA
MYGTVARLRIKPGMEQQLVEFSIAEDAARIPGLLTEFVYRMDKDEQEYMLAVVFESKEAYWANANSPEQDERYHVMRSLLEADPEWYDGGVVHFYRVPEETPSQ